jgi:hypothetical protein
MMATETVSSSRIRREEASTRRTPAAKLKWQSHHRLPNRWRWRHLRLSHSETPRDDMTVGRLVFLGCLQDSQFRDNVVCNGSRRHTICIFSFGMLYSRRLTTMVGTATVITGSKMSINEVPPRRLTRTTTTKDASYEYICIQLKIECISLINVPFIGLVH